MPTELPVNGRRRLAVELHGREPAVTANVYLDEEAATTFGASINYDSLALHDVGKRLVDRLKHTKVPKRPPHNLLDVGVGTGAFTVPILNYFCQDADVDATLHCCDTSSPMLSQLAHRIACEPRLAPVIDMKRMDAEEGLLHVYRERYFDVCIVTFVFHYLKSWRRLISHIHKCLAADGVFLQAEITGDMAIIDGQTQLESANATFLSFWREYFAIRARHSAWLPEISVSNLGPVLPYCLEEGGFLEISKNIYSWQQELKWNTFLAWIETGALSSLGSGLAREARCNLAQHMRRWLAVRSISIESPLAIDWGFRTIWLQKESTTQSSGV